MHNRFRGLLAIVAGFIVWFAVATFCNFAIRWLLPGYAEVEQAMDFSLPMLLVRLVLGTVASLAAGAACVAIGRSRGLAVYLFAVLLVALFVPLHVNLWAKFPVWYHVVFLGSLAPLVLLGAKVLGTRGERAA